MDSNSDGRFILVVCETFAERTRRRAASDTNPMLAIERAMTTELALLRQEIAKEAGTAKQQVENGS